MAKKIVPLNLSIPREAPKTAMGRIGVNRARFNWLIEEGEIVLMASAPGVVKTVVSASVDAYIAKINARATVAAM